MEVRSYRDLAIWQKAVDLAVYCYAITRGFPPDERYGLISQIRRASASIPANVAEGHARRRSREYLRYLGIASGSLAELETHVMIAQRLEMLDVKTADDFLCRASEIGRMLTGLRASIEARLRRSDPSP